MKKLLVSALIALSMSNAQSMPSFSTAAQPLAALAQKNPVLVPVVALGAPFAASYLYAAVNGTGYLPAAKIRKSISDAKDSIAKRLSRGFKAHPMVATILALVAGNQLFAYSPALRQALIDAPLKKNPWLTAVVYGGAAACVFAGDKIAQWIPEVPSPSSKQPKN